MSFHQFKRIQKVQASLDQTWDFISEPINLSRITPDYMQFEILNAEGYSKMYEGMIISYHVRPFLNIKMNWVTEITQIKEREFFIDEQRVGPYTMWHHEHHIVEIEDYVLMTDIISYVPPFGILGRLANNVIINKKLEEIFDYRQVAIADWLEHQ